MRTRRRFAILTIGLAIVMLLSACLAESPERIRLTPLTCQILPDGREVKTFELGGSYWQVPCEAPISYHASQIRGSSATLHPIIIRSGDVEWGRVWHYPDGHASPIRVTMRLGSTSNPMYALSQIARATRLSTEFGDLEHSVRASPKQFGSRFYWLEGTRHEAIIGIPLDKDHPLQSRWVRCISRPQPGYSAAPWEDWLNTCSVSLRLTLDVIAGFRFHSDQLPLVDELVTNLHAELMNAKIPTPFLPPEV